MTYGPPRWRPFALLAAALVTAAAAIAILPLWPFAAVLLAAAARDAWCRPALEITSEGVRYLAGRRRAFAAWGLVDAVRVRQERHFLAFGSTLEIDLSDDTLVVLSRTQLGAAPDLVAAAVESGWQQALRSEQPF